MASPIEIINKALIDLGQSAITSFSEEIAGKYSLDVKWDMARKSLLRAHYWNFAMMRVELAQSSTAPAFGYSYKYALPVNCLRVVQVNRDDNYKLENGFILTNSPTCFLKYIADITDTLKWSSDFVELMAAKLAAELSFTVTRDKDLIPVFNSLYKNALEQARINDASEDIEDVFIGGTSLIDVRAM